MVVVEVVVRAHGCWKSSGWATAGVDVRIPSRVLGLFWEAIFEVEYGYFNLSLDCRMARWSTVLDEMLGYLKQARRIVGASRG